MSKDYYSDVETLIDSVLFSRTNKNIPRTSMGDYS